MTDEQTAGKGGMAGYAAAAREVFAEHPLRAPEIMAKALLCRALYGFGPDSFLMFDLHNRSVGGWRDYMKLYPDFSRALKLINWRSGNVTQERDKVRTSERCAEAGIAFAPIFAILGRDRAAYPVSPAFRTVDSVDEAAELLADPAAPAELFVKPCADFGGRGLIAATRAGNGWLVDGEVVAARSLAERVLAAGGAHGMMVQPLLRNHPAMEAIGGAFGLCTVRINLALTSDGPVVFACALKLLGRAGLADNFHGGRTGNLLAQVEIDTGRILAVYGRKAGHGYLLSRYGSHPATGRTLHGFQLPFWAETLALAKRTASVFPESPLLGLDIAITAEGPTLLEKNLHWDTTIPQIVRAEGVRAMFRRFLPRLVVDDRLREQACRLIGVERSGEAHAGTPANGGAQAEEALILTQTASLEASASHSPS